MRLQFAMMLSVARLALTLAALVKRLGLEVRKVYRDRCRPTANLLFEQLSLGVQLV